MIIGFTCGVFDLFHAGHVLMLKECKQHCDYLIVALNKGENISAEINPGKRQPVYTIEERLLIMESCRYVNEVICYNSEDELYEILRTKGIDKRFLGNDYLNKPMTGENLGIEIVYINRDHGISSTSLLKRIKDNFTS